MNELEHLRRRVLDQLTLCREPAEPDLPAGLTANDVRAIRREELRARLAVYRAYRKALTRP